MSTELVVPYIAREDYDNFRRDIGLSLPEDYSVWSRIFADEVDAARNSGKSVVLSPVLYDDFLAKCRTSSSKPNHKTLLLYAINSRRAASALSVKKV